MAHNQQYVSVLSKVRFIFRGMCFTGDTEKSFHGPFLQNGCCGDKLFTDRLLRGGGATNLTKTVKRLSLFSNRLYLFTTTLLKIAELNWHKKFEARRISVSMTNLSRGILFWTWSIRCKKNFDHMLHRTDSRAKWNLSCRFQKIAPWPRRGVL